MTIELAPHHKVGLMLTSPLILAAGVIGYGDALPRALDLSRCGAWVTAPIGLRPCPGSPPPRLAEVPGGLVLAETGQNPGVGRVIQQYGPSWPHLGLPVIARLWGTMEDQAVVARRLEKVESVAALELAPADALGPEAAADLVRMVRQACDLPLLVALPLLTDEAEWAIACAEAGADALVVGQPPRALGLTADGAPVHGRLYSPVVAPLAWAALERITAAGLGLPLIGAGGIHHPADARAFLRLGAVAFQVDTAIWVDPTLLARIATITEEPEQA